MEENKVSNSRWSEYIQVIVDGRAIGFKLPNNQFLFKYDQDGGWQDQDGHYYNAEGILQPDDENSQDDEDQLSDHEDQIVDKFQKLLLEQEEGISYNHTKKNQKEQQASPKKAKQQEGELDFTKLFEEYTQSKDRLREGLPNELFLYFKQKVDYYQKIVPEVQKRQNVDEKRKAVQDIKKNIQNKYNDLKSHNSWLNTQGVFLDCSGDSYQANLYDRYWYGVIKTTPQKYLETLDQISKSKEFKILQIKTYYALKSKLYLKKGQQKIKATIADLRSKIQPIGKNQTASLLIDGLPQRFPCSYVYDLVEYAGGKIEDVESVIIEDDFSATVTCNKEAALLLINLEGYNHDRGQYIEISFCEVKNQFYEQGKHKFYYISVDNKYKLHQRELNDTLGLQPSKQELAKHATKQQDEEEHFRFVIGSTSALKRVLMFRGDSLNVERVLPTPSK